MYMQLHKTRYKKELRLHIIGIIEVLGVPLNRILILMAILRRVPNEVEVSFLTLDITHMT